MTGGDNEERCESSLHLPCLPSSTTRPIRGEFLEFFLSPFTGFLAFSSLLESIEGDPASLARGGVSKSESCNNLS